MSKKNQVNDLVQGILEGILERLIEGECEFPNCKENDNRGLNLTFEMDGQTRTDFLCVTHIALMMEMQVRLWEQTHKRKKKRKK